LESFLLKNTELVNNIKKKKKKCKISNKYIKIILLKKKKLVKKKKKKKKKCKVSVKYIRIILLEKIQYDFYINVI